MLIAAAAIVAVWVIGTVAYATSTFVRMVRFAKMDAKNMCDFCKKEQDFIATKVVSAWAEPRPMLLAMLSWGSEWPYRVPVELWAIMNGNGPWRCKGRLIESSCTL